MCHCMKCFSQCRAKNSDSVVESVKLEIYRSTTPEHVKIYLVNDEHFETVETNILRKVLQDKYKVNTNQM